MDRQIPDFLASLPSAKAPAKPQPIPPGPKAEKPKSEPVARAVKSKPAPKPAIDLPTEDGMYFGLPEDAYHSIPRLSASGIKTLIGNPYKFWKESAFNPRRKPSEDTSAKKLGRAYHKLLLEGDAAFDAVYAARPSKEDYPDAIDGSDALKAECERLGLSKGGGLLAMCDRILTKEPAMELWPVIVREFEEENAGKESLTKAQWEEIQEVRFVLNHLPDIKGAFTNGCPEVTILWTQNGVPMKCRLDYLKPRGNFTAILDLKSFANVMDIPVENAPSNEIGRNRYFVQPIAYTTGWEAMRDLYRKRGKDIIHVISGDAPGKDWLDSVLLPERSQFDFVFVQTGGIPNIIPREFAPGQTFGGQGFESNEYWMRGLIEFRNGVDRFRKYAAEYGTDTPWIVAFGLKKLSDLDFKPWALEYERDLPEEEAA